MNETKARNGTARTGSEGRPAPAPGPLRAGEETAVYAFARLDLDALRFELRRNDQRVPVQPKPLALLLHLVRHRERLVPREELVALLWSDVVVSEDALFHAVKMARDAVGDPGARPGSRPCPHRVRGGPRPPPCPARPRRAARSADAPARRPRDLPAGPARAARGRGGRREDAAPRDLRANRPGSRRPGLLRRVPAGRRTVLGPWSQLLDGLLAGATDAVLAGLAKGESGASLARIAPSLRERLPASSLAVPLDGSDTEPRWRLFAAVSGLLAILSERRALVLDDLHRADVATLRLAEHLVGELPRLPVFLVGAARDEGVGSSRALAPLLGEAARLEVGGPERVERLARDDVGLLLDRLAGAAPSPALVEAVYARTDGNPFFVVQVARKLTRELAHEIGPDVGDTSAAWEDALAGVPPGVQQVVAGRLARLDRARVLLARGRTDDRERARALLREAAAAAERLGLARIAEEAHAAQA